MSPTIIKSNHRTIHRNPFEVPVSFTDEQLVIIKDIAKERGDFKDSNSHLVADKRIIKRDNVETHVIGLLGEVAVARLINATVDTELYLKGNDSEDLNMYGVSIEVKTLQGYLTFKHMSDFKSDVAVLTVYNKQDYSMVWVQGWISKYDFQKSHFIDNFGYGDRPCVQPAELVPIVTLKSYCVSTRNLRYIKEGYNG